MKPIAFFLNGREISAGWEPAGPGIVRVRLPGEERVVEAAVESMADGSWRLSFEGRTHRVHAAHGREELHLAVAGASFAAVRAESVRKGVAGQGGPTRTVAPLPGIVRKILVAPGEAVKRGQVVALMEAMKMECPGAAGADGVVKRLCVEPGKTVDAGTELMEIQ